MITLESGENVIRLVRKHWFVMLLRAIGSILFAIVPPVFYGVLTDDRLGILETMGLNIPEIVLEWALFFYLLWLLLLWILYFIEWTDYYLDMWVLTNRRIIDIEQNGFFHRKVISFNYEQVQDVKVEVRGIIATAFKFGFLKVETAGERLEMAIKYAANPEEVRSVILREQEKRQGKRVDGTHLETGFPTDGVATLN